MMVLKVNQRLDKAMINRSFYSWSIADASKCVDQCISSGWINAFNPNDLH